MVVPDFDTSRNRECFECHRFGFDDGDWQFMGWNDEVDLYICPDCQSLAMTDDGDMQTRVAEQRDAPVHAEQGGESSEAKCTTDRLCPVHNIWHAPRPTRSAGG